MATPYLSHLFLEVADLDRARWFWIEALGLTLLQDRGGYLQVGDADGSGFQLGIEQKPESAVAPRDYPEITLRVHDCDTVARGLEAIGVTIEEGAGGPALGRAARLVPRPGRAPDVGVFLGRTDHGAQS